MPEQSVDSATLWLLALVWALWCVPHSLLLWPWLRVRLEAAWGLRPSAYRFWYSVASVFTIAPVVWWTWRLGGFFPYFWSWPWWPLQVVLMAAGVLLMIWADRSFRRGSVDLFGWSEMQESGERTPALVVAGPYGHVRHPMHVAAVILVWSRSMNSVDVVVNLVLTAYIISANFWEERRMLAQFGDSYREYQARVPMWGWRIRG